MSNGFHHQRDKTSSASGSIHEPKRARIDIKRPALSKDGREAVEKVFKTRNEGSDPSTFCDRVDALLGWICRGKPIKPVRPAKIRQELFDLQEVLTSLHPETRDALGDSYVRVFPMPSSRTRRHPKVVRWEDLLSLPPAERKRARRRLLNHMACEAEDELHNQDANTHIVRIMGKSSMTMPVACDELIARLLQACDEALRQVRQLSRRGPPEAIRLKVFIESLSHYVLAHTGRKPTSTPSAFFDQLLIAILQDVTDVANGPHADETPTGASRRKLIDSALKNSINPDILSYLDRLRAAMGNRLTVPPRYAGTYAELMAQIQQEVRQMYRSPAVRTRR